MKSTIILLAVLVSGNLFAKDLVCVDYYADSDSEVIIEDHGNPRNHADAFVTLNKADNHSAGWAWINESPATFYKTTTYKLGGSFTRGATLVVVVKPKTCGRGSCDNGEFVTTAKLVGHGEDLYLSCN